MMVAGPGVDGLMRCRQSGSGISRRRRKRYAAPPPAAAGERYLAEVPRDKVRAHGAAADCRAGGWAGRACARSIITLFRDCILFVVLAASVFYILRLLFTLIRYRTGPIPSPQLAMGFSAESAQQPQPPQGGQRLLIQASRLFSAYIACFARRTSARRLPPHAMMRVMMIFPASSFAGSAGRSVTISVAGVFIASARPRRLSFSPARSQGMGGRRSRRGSRRLRLHGTTKSAIPPIAGRVAGQRCRYAKPKRLPLANLSAGGRRHHDAAAGGGHIVALTLGAGWRALSRAAAMRRCSPAARRSPAGVRPDRI